jgi:hypothetical protein
MEIASTTQKKNEVLVNWAPVSNINCLKITFSGVFTKDQATNAAARWKEVMSKADNKKQPVIFDCKKMTDYEPMARIIWQNTINELSKKIECIWVVTDSKLIIAGAAILSLFSSLKIKTATTEEGITF